MPSRCAPERSAARAPSASFRAGTAPYRNLRAREASAAAKDACGNRVASFPSSSILRPDKQQQIQLGAGLLFACSGVPRLQRIQMRSTGAESTLLNATEQVPL